MRVKKPKTLAYGNMPVKVKWAKALRGAFGDYTPDDRQIRVQEHRVPAPMQMETLIHECFHLIIRQNEALNDRFREMKKQGEVFEEEVVDTLARDFSEIVLRNPLLVQWIVAVANNNV